MPDTAPSDWIAKVRAAERSGNFIIAYDTASQGLAEHPDNNDLRYLATRVLARSGATDQAAALYQKFGLARDPQLDFAMLGARIAKDMALAASAKRPAALHAAAAYRRIYARTHDHYPAVNAATLYLLGGDRKRARLYARRGLKATEHGSNATAIDRYYCLASRAEAALICGDVAQARRSLQDAAANLDGNLDAAAATRKQLRLVCRATRINPDILDPLRPPSVLHYYAPVFAGRPIRRDAAQRVLAERIAEYVKQHRIGYAYGSLSAQGEILCAEVCLNAGIELHVVLPFDEDEFVATMVAPGGRSWVQRFKACLDRAKAVTFATVDSYQGDTSLFTYAGRLAMGMAVLHAQRLDTEGSTISLLMDGWHPDPSGHAADRAIWRARGLAADRLASSKPAIAIRRGPKGPAPIRHVPPRFSRAIVFGDVKGFSKTPDHLIPVFQKHLMGAIAGALSRYGRRVLYRASWGDAIYVVIDDPIVAAECCLDIQKAIGRAKVTRYGLSPDLALRLSAHFGPVYDGFDPIRSEPTFFGIHTTITARIEPVTPPGHVYVTEAMAAAIAMANAPHLHVEYVGNIPMAKGFGSAPMYALSRTG
jgi:hypothetical protein